jgi:hypothetical protein
MTSGPEPPVATEKRVGWKAEAGAVAAGAPDAGAWASAGAAERAMRAERKERERIGRRIAETIILNAWAKGRVKCGGLGNIF